MSKPVPKPGDKDFIGPPQPWWARHTRPSTHGYKVLNTKPSIPQKDNKATSSNTYTKIATSNLYYENDTPVVVDELTRLLFDKISGKEMLSLANNVQVSGLINNISNISQINNSFSSTAIIPITTIQSIYSKSINNISGTVNGGNVTLTTDNDNAGGTPSGINAGNQVVVVTATPKKGLRQSFWGPIEQWLA